VHAGSPRRPSSRSSTRTAALVAAVIAVALATVGCSTATPDPATTSTTGTASTASTAPAGSTPSPPAGTSPGTSSPATSSPGAGSRGSVPGTEPAGPTGTVGTAPRTAPPRSTAKITRFDAPPTIACNGLVNVKVTTTYSTTDATSVAFLVDNQQVPGSPPTSGSFELPMRCDGSAHTIVLSAIDDQGRSAVQSKAILTDDRESGG